MFYDTFDKLCAEKGVSNNKAASEMGLGNSTVTRWKKSGSTPDGATLAKIARYFGVSMDYLVGNELLVSPTATEDTVPIPIIGEVAASYGRIGYEDWTGETLDIPRSWLRGRTPSNYFVLQVHGQSMYPDYQDGDHVLVLRQSTMDRSGQIGVVIYGDELSTLKRIEYVMGEDWMILRPINPQFPPITIRGEDLEHCRVLGVAKMVVRELKQ